MRKIIFSVIFLLALLLLAEVGVTLLSQRGMERALRSQYELPDSLEVSINSFPYIVSLARNHLAEVRLEWSDKLMYQAGEGVLESVDYGGRVSLYDVELNMPSLLTGKLEMRHISRQNSRFFIEIEALNLILGLPQGSLKAENDRLYLSAHGKKAQYKVKVAGDNAIVVEPYLGYMAGTASGIYPDPSLEAIELTSLPMGAVLLNACINSGRVEIEISIPMWEGYL